MVSAPGCRTPGSDEAGVVGMRRPPQTGSQGNCEMTQTGYELQQVEGGSPIKMWTRGVPVDDKARDQLAKAAKMPFIFKHVAAMTR